MTNYVILSPNISNVGGAQIYIRNKINFLKHNNFKPLIMHASTQSIVIEELKEFSNNCFEFINYQPILFSKKKVDKYLNFLAEKIDISCETIVESHTISNAFWGELLAEKLNCKHIVFLLNENFPLLTEDEYQFFEFKHKRRELVGISVNTIPMLMRGYKNIDKDEAYRLPATCINSVEDIDADWVENFVMGDYTIASLGRLDKLYQKEMANAIVKFANSYPDKEISVLLIGGAENEVFEKNLKKIYRKAKNINLYITGYIYPVPRKIFSKVDVFIETAGAAKTVYFEKKIVITVDATDALGIGVLGHTTINILYRDKSEKAIEVYDLLIDVLIKKLYSNKDPQLNVLPAMLYDNGLAKFSSHVEFINNTSNIRKYYNIRGVKRYGKSIKKNILRTIIIIFGPKIYLRISRIYRILK